MFRYQYDGVFSCPISIPSSLQNSIEYRGEQAIINCSLTICFIVLEILSQSEIDIVKDSETRNSERRLTAVSHYGIARLMAQTLESCALNSKALFAEQGLDLDEITLKDERVPAMPMQAIWRRAVELTGDEGFGLACAKNLHPAAFQGLGFAWIASATLKDAFHRLVRYYRLISSEGEVVLQESDDDIWLWYKIPQGGQGAPASLDAALAVFIQLCRFTKGDDFNPKQVEFQHAAPTDKSKFDAFFKCPIVFSADENRLLFSRQELEVSLPMASPSLARANDQVVIDYIKKHDKGNIVNAVRGCIIELLPSGEVSQESVARQVNRSSRSLQRKLAEHGTSYKQLYEEIRKELAMQYLKETNRTISEVTYLLGFSEPSNFARSFKRWCGTTPNEYQSNLKN